MLDYFCARCTATLLESLDHIQDDMYKSEPSFQHSSLRQQMNNNCFDTNHKDPDNPVPLQAGTHNQDFQIRYTAQILGAFPKQFESSQLILDSETDETTSIKYECDFDRTFNIPWSLEGASCTETLLQFLEQDQENRSESQPVFRDNQFSSRQSQRRFKPKKFYTTTQDGCSETLQEFLEHNQDSMYQAQPVFQDSRFSIIQSCSDTLLEFLEQNQESMYKSQPVFMDSQFSTNQVRKRRNQAKGLFITTQDGYTGTLLEFLEQNQENMYNSQPFFVDSQFSTKQVRKRRNQAKGLFTTTQDGYALHGHRPRHHDGALRSLTHVPGNSTYQPLKEIQETVRNKIILEQLHQKAYFDKRRSSDDATCTTGKPTKGQSKYRGPLVGLKVFPDGNTYRVSQFTGDVKQKHFATTAHVSQLKSWGNKDKIDDGEPVSDESEDDKSNGSELKTTKPDSSPVTFSDSSDIGEIGRDQDSPRTRPIREQRRTKYLKDFVTRSM
uniref:Uncharacterized protein n=1 Tax=Timema bartmani TaxID=61472 RepID=A0A7R9HXG7_9NEOP|nr:unnamed protein product [Timema bartmani]